jgi:hypothetical protein
MAAMLYLLYLKHIASSLYMRNSRCKCLGNANNESGVSYLEVMRVVELDKATECWNKVETVLSLKYKNQ